MASPTAAGRAPAGYTLHVVLFLATVLTTLFAGGVRALLFAPPLAGGWWERALAGAETTAVAGAPFATALVGILLCHEMGHYLLARVHGVDATLPFFIPMPAPPVGTLGAVIRIRSKLPSRLATLDIGLAGPFAGAVVALPLLAWGIARSRVLPAAAGLTPHPGLVELARALLYGRSITTGEDHWGNSLLTWGMQRLVLGPLPPGTQVAYHPVAFAAWVGLFVTTLNLIPIGQLDGGHATYALLGRGRARALSHVVSWGLLAAGLFLSWSWIIWWAVTRFAVKLDHPPALDEQPLGRGRQALAVLALLLFAVTFMPVPISF
jgi:membrane-associated protease RseP (regulator of RpoE activity)